MRFKQSGQALVNLPLLLANFDTLPVQDRDPGAVVAAIFQPPQPLDDDGGRGPFADITNDTAHNIVSKPTLPASTPARNTLGQCITAVNLFIGHVHEPLEGLSDAGAPVNDPVTSI
jgi:hypothetical protein